MTADPNPFQTVIDTLLAEHHRVNVKLEGSRKRLTYAVSQQALEEALIVEQSANLSAIEATLTMVGGVIPKLDEGDELYADDPPPTRVTM